MPEYLAPGIFVEEVSYRSKSIEGVGTTTTGFVGPARYGPVEIEPEVITNVTEFERIYGGGTQLDFSSGGRMHNYLWHGARAFFEEGGKRLYVARVFRPSVDPDNNGYIKPSDDITKDLATLGAAGDYGTDGHARTWLTKAGLAVSVGERAVQALVIGVQGLSSKVDAASAATTWEADKPADQQDDDSPLLCATQVVDTLGKDGPSGGETGVAKLLVQADAKVGAAKLAFPASTLDMAALKTAMAEVRSAAALAAVASGDLSPAKVLVPAATAAKSSATAAGVELGKAGDFAAAVAAHAAAPQALKDLATPLAALCAGPAGAAWLAFEKATAATADGLAKAGAVVDAATRAAALSAARKAVDEWNASLTQKEAVHLAVERIAARAVADGVVDPALKGILSNLSLQYETLAAAFDRAQRDALFGAYPRAFAVSTLTAKRDALLASLQTIEQQAAQTLKNVKGGPRPPAELDAAMLVRARFPGAAGNAEVRVVASLGQNILVADPADATKSTLRGIQAGDLVRIGQTSGAAQLAADKLYLAWQAADSKDWYFSSDDSTANAAYWLNNPSGRRLDPAMHEVSIVTARVDFVRANGKAETLAGLALQPGHKRNGAADALTDKFSPSPDNGNDARTLPFVILMDKSVKNGRDVFRSLINRDPAEATDKIDWPISAAHQLLGGNDGQRPGAAEYAGRGEGPDAPKTGLKSFQDIEDIAIVAAPGATFGYMNEYRVDAQQIVSSLIAHAENMRYRIAVLESGNGQSLADVREMRARYDSKYAAFYYPWVRVLDPITRGEIHLPPSGFVAGIYARNDIERAVFKAPANEVVRSAIGFEMLLNKAQQEVLNPEGINCFRFFEGRGFRLWGARTISSDPEWKYVNVRRYFAYLEHSIDRGSQWAVFEPNGEALWVNVRETISDFLYNEWKNGALLGSDPKSAYFVRCDRSTMTQNDLDNGRLVCKIGVAVLKPAEFVIFQIGQWTADRKA